MAEKNNLNFISKLKKTFSKISDNIKKLFGNKTFKNIVLVILILFMPLLLLIKSQAVSTIFFILLFLWLWLMMKNIIKSLVVIISLIIVFIFAVEIAKDVVIIKKITIPANFEKVNVGYTEEVLANHLFDAIYKYEQIDGNETDFEHVFQSTNAMPEIQIPTIKYSINSLFQYLKKSEYFQKLFNYKYIIIDGDIISKGVNSDEWILTIRIDLNNLKSSKSIDWNTGKAIQESGEFLIKHLDPSVILKYYLIQGDFKRIIEVGEDMVANFPIDYQVLNLLGLAYNYTGNYEKAIYYLTKSLNFKPKNAGANYLLGNAFSKTNNPNEAITYYKEAIKTNPDNPQAYRNLAKIYEAKGMNEKAIDYYNFYLKTANKNGKANEPVEKKIKTLRKKTD